MGSATKTAVLAGTAATAAYLDAKFHLWKDIHLLWSMRDDDKEYQRAVKTNRQSCFYFFEEPVRNHPDAQAIWSREGNYTWQETHDRACQYAAYFLEIGVKPGELVAFYLQNAPELLFAWLGLWAIGCAPAMINFNLGGDTLIHCLRTSGAKVLLVDGEDKVGGRIEAERNRIEGELGMQPITLSAGLKNATAARTVQRPDDSYREGVSGKFPAVLLYTSGTTGLPKAAQFSTARMHITGARRSRTIGQRRGPGGDRWYGCMPMYHGTGGITAMTNMMSGVSLAIGKGFSTRNFWRDVRDSESTFIIYVGETARYLLAAPPSPLDRQHKVRCMYGNGLRPDVWERFRERFGIPEVLEFFNSSEGMLSLGVWNRGDYSSGCVGHHGALIRLITKNQFVPVQTDNETNDLVRDPETGWAKRKSYEKGGEILVKMPDEGSFPGYWNDPGSTNKKIVRDVFQKGDVFYRTGDALRRTPDGRWLFVDRLGDTYRWKSENVSTAEVAEVIGRFPGILEANVYGVQIPQHEGRAGCAALHLAAEKQKNFDWASFSSYVKKSLPKYAVPVFVRVMEGHVGGMASHNNKQDKVSLRYEGVDPDKKGSKVPNGKADQLFWLPPKSDMYEYFEKEGWHGLESGRTKL